MKKLSLILIFILITALSVLLVTDRFKVRYKPEIDYYADEYSLDRHLVMRSSRRKARSIPTHCHAKALPGSCR